MDKLKPCPFCGGKAKKEIGEYKGDCLVHCTKCRCSIISHVNVGIAIKAWNTRSGESSE